jgi:hypothetical protein
VPLRVRVLEVRLVPQDILDSDESKQEALVGDENDAGAASQPLTPED